MGGDAGDVVRFVQNGGVELSDAIILARDARDYLRQQRRPELANAVEALRLAALVKTEDTLTATQVARMIGLHRNTVRNWVNAGLLPAVKVGRRGDLRVPRSEAERVRVMIRNVDAMGYFTPEEMQEYFEVKRLSGRAARERREREDHEDREHGDGGRR
jgi:excisionase family DNA binding protein